MTTNPNCPGVPHRPDDPLYRYANDNDPQACHWMSCLPIRIDRIDDRSIAEIKGADLDGFTQCHFFAGIGGWPYALHLAGWPNDVPVWTGSCPCQPFSSAGKRKGIEDERHLWPEFLRLIAECRPPTIFGEQVASKGGREWLAGVRTDLEALGYAVGAADLCAAGVGAPHIRQRLFWVADSDCDRCDQKRVRLPATRNDGAIGNGVAGGLGNAMQPGLAQRERNSGVQREAGRASQGQAAELSSCWGEYIWILCGDGKARRIEPGIRPLAHGIPGRVAQLRGLGNAIVPQVAAEFVKAFMETTQ